MVRLLCIDIDGTLLNSKKELPEENIEAVRYAMSQGVTVAIASGRSVIGMKPLMEELGTGDRAVCLNGALVLCGGRAIHTAVMEESLIMEVIRRAEYYNSQIFLSSASFNITNGSISRSLKELIDKGSLRSDYIYCKDYEELRRLAREHSGEILKIALKEVDEAHFKELRQDLLQSGLFHVAKSDTCFVDVTPRGCNKASGVRALAEYLSIPMEQVMCIGDNENDLEMLEAAGIGVAMGNGAEMAKAAADYITGDNDSGGFAEAIYHFIGKGRQEG